MAPRRKAWMISPAKRPKSRSYDALSVDECTKAIQNDPWFVP